MTQTSVDILDPQAERPRGPGEPRRDTPRLAPPAPARFRSVVMIQALLLAALLGFLYWDPIRNAAEAWSSDPDWSHGWLVPLFALYLLHARRDRFIDSGPRHPYTSLLGLLILVGALAAYAFFLAVLPYGYPRPLSLVLAIFGLVLYLGGPGVIRVAWLPIFFLALAIPIPDSIYVRLTMPLRMITTRAATVILSAIPGLELEPQGVIIDYAFRGYAGQLNVEEACAGMRLMMAFVTLGVAAAWLGERPLWQRIVMLAACVPIAVLCNVVRVAVTGTFTVYQWTDLAQGTPHELVGLAMLPLALGLFSIAGWVLRRLVVEAPE